MAVACVRSLFELAEEIERTLPAGAGKIFRLKAAVHSGVAHFTKLESGFNLSGLPYSESAKFLTHVENGFANSVLGLADSCQESVSHICKLSSLKAGVSTVEQFIPQEVFLEKNKAEYCTYYRSDVNLMALMKYMENLVDSQNDELFFRVFGDLKHVKNHVICSDLEKSFTQFLEFTYRKSHNKPVDPKILSAAVSLAQNLIPQSSVTEKLTEILKLYLQFADARVQANAVLVLGETPSNVRFLKKFIHSDHNRLSADALLVTGKQVVDKELVGRVQSLLRSSDKVNQASGRYVALKLVEHYKQNDMLYFNTNPHLKKLEELLGKAA
jgi:adenylate cyclase